MQIHWATLCFSDYVYKMNPITTGRIERAPLSAFSLFFNMMCIIGNSAVLHIFRTKYKKSNYRFFVLLLASFDMGSGIVFGMKEQFRIQRVYHGGTSVACQVLNYVGHSVGMGTVFMVLFIAVERYKKICTPFQTQFTIAQCVRFCVIAIIISAIFNIPTIFIFGKREFKIENINASRCCVLKRLDGTIFPILYFGSLNTVSLSVVISIIVIQLKIRAVISRQSQLKKRMIFTCKTKPKKAETPISCEDGNNVDNEIKLPAITMTIASREMSTKKKTSDESKAVRIAVTFCIITALLIISIQAMFMNEIILSVSRYLRPEDKISKNQDIFNVYFPDIFTLNGMLNPFIYFFVDNKFRHEVKTLCRR